MSIGNIGGDIGGIPVVSEERSGARIATPTAKGKSMKKAAIATGQNMGNKTPPKPTAWKSIGNRIASAINTALSVICCVRLRIIVSKSI